MQKYCLLNYTDSIILPILIRLYLCEIQKLTLFDKDITLCDTFNYFVT